MKFILLSIFGILMTLTTQAQINGSVAITEEPSIRQIMDHRKSLNFDNKRKIKAWSVQISLTRDKYQATKKVSEVKNQYKHLDHEIDWFYENPYYRLYTGAFYTKIEAASLLHQLVEDYPSAIIFKNNQVKPNILK